MGEISKIKSSTRQSISRSRNSRVIGLPYNCIDNESPLTGRTDIPRASRCVVILASSEKLKFLNTSPACRSFSRERNAGVRAQASVTSGIAASAVYNKPETRCFRASSIMSGRVRSTQELNESTRAARGLVGCWWRQVCSLLPGCGWLPGCSFRPRTGAHRASNKEKASDSECCRFCCAVGLINKILPAVTANDNSNALSCDFFHI